MKLIIFAAVVAIAYGGACGKAVTVGFSGLAADNVVIIKAATTGSAATCDAAGAFGAAKDGTLETEANLKAQVDKGSPADAANVSSGDLAWVACKTGYTGTLKYKCASATAAIGFDGCKALDTCAADVGAQASGAITYAAFGAGTKVGSSASTACTAPKSIKGKTVTAACTAKDTWGAAGTTACGAAAFWGTCPIPTCGNADTTATVTCNATSGTESDCGVAQKKTDAGFACAKDATSSCTAPTCAAGDAFAASGKKEAACAKTAAVAIGTVQGPCTCTLRCKSDKKAASINLAGWSCKTVADTEGYWKCASSTTPTSSANTLSVFAAFLTVLAYLA